MEQQARSLTLYMLKTAILQYNGTYSCCSYRNTEILNSKSKTISSSMGNHIK